MHQLKLKPTIFRLEATSGQSRTAAQAEAERRAAERRALLERLESATRAQQEAERNVSNAGSASTRRDPTRPDPARTLARSNVEQCE